MNSLKTKLTLRLLLGGIVLLGIAGSVFHWRMKRALIAGFDEDLKVAAQSIGAFVDEENLQLEMDPDVDDLPQFNRASGDAFYLLTDSAGKEINRSRSMGSQTLAPRGGTWGDPEIFETAFEDGRRFRCIGVYFDHQENSSSRPSRLLLIVGRVTTPVEETLKNARTSLWVAGAVPLAALAGLLHWGIRRGLLPLDHLVGEISKVDGRTLATRFPVHDLPVELQPIALRLNELLARLESAFDREKRYTANVAHELRTPLAELRILAEVSLMIPAADPADHTARWHDVKTVAARMESLALRLLELARSEHAGNHIQPETIDIATMLAATWDRLAAAAARRGITFQPAIAEGACLETDPVLLDLIVTNLMGNAVEHAVPDTVFTVSATGGILRFTNRVTDVDEADLSYLFERFWKKDASRSDGRRHGLGLALASETALLLGARLDARLTAGPSLEFTLTFA